MTINRFMIEAMSSDEENLNQLLINITALLKRSLGENINLESSIEEELGLEKKEIVLTILLSITANLATDGLKKAIDLLPLVESGECSVNITQIVEVNGNTGSVYIDQTINDNKI